MNIEDIEKENTINILEILNEYGDQFDDLKSVGIDDIPYALSEFQKEIFIFLINRSFKKIPEYAFSVMLMIITTITQEYFSSITGGKSNLFVLVFGKQGSGKTGYKELLEDILSSIDENLISHNFRSLAALQKNFVKTNSFLLITDEVQRNLKEAFSKRYPDPLQKELYGARPELWSRKSRIKKYSTKNESDSISEVLNPILSTYECGIDSGLEEVKDNPHFIDEGLFSRTLIFYNESLRKTPFHTPKKEKESDVEKDDDLILKLIKIKNTLNLLHKGKKKSELDLKEYNDYVYIKYCQLKTIEDNNDNENKSLIRISENFLRICSVLCNPCFCKPNEIKTSIEISIWLSIYLYKNKKRFLSIHKTEDNLIEDIIGLFKKWSTDSRFDYGVTIRDLYVNNRKFRALNPNQRESIIRELESSGVIHLVHNNCKKTKKYRYDYDYKYHQL